MKLKHLFTINAVISSIFGLSLLFMPVQLFTLYGQQIDPTSAAIARMWGTAISGYAILTFLSRDLPDSAARRKIVLALFLYFTIGFLANLYNQITVSLTPIDWSTPLIFMLLAIGYGYFHFKKPKS